MQLSVAIQRYLRHHRASGSAADTLHWHDTSLKQFLAHAGDMPLEELDADSLREWQLALTEGHAQATIATRHRSLKAFGAWLLAEGYLDRHPFKRVARPNLDDMAQRVLTKEEARLLLAQPNKYTLTGLRDYAMLCVMYSTGLRAAEVCRLKLSDIDEGTQQLTVRRGKGGKFRKVPYSPRAERAVNRYHAQRPDSPWVFSSLKNPAAGITPGNLGRIVRGYAAKAGLPDVHPHTLRHSFAVEYLRNDGHLADLQIIMGHSDIKITQHYARIAGVDIVRRHRDADPLGNL